MHTGTCEFGDTNTKSNFFSVANFKAKNARKFLEDGNKVKITVRFRGRELNNTKMGEEVLSQFIKNLEDVSVVEKKPKLEGKNMFIILAKKAN